MGLIEETDARLRRAREGVFNRLEDDALTELPPLPEDVEVEEERIVGDVPPVEEDDEQITSLGSALLEALREAGRESEEEPQQ